MNQRILSARPGISALLLAALAAGGCADKPAGMTLSRDDAFTTPLGGVEFHGPFASDPVVATASGLPKHDFVAIEFDLFVLRSWDGSVPADGGTQKAGPDLFRAAVVRGPVLLDTTFSCVPNEPGFYPDSQQQNYPSAVPGDRLPAWTGAAARNSLGYHYPYPGPPNLVGMDATYKIRLLVPHRDASIAVCLSAKGLASVVDESWGFRGLTVTPLSKDQVDAPGDDASVAKAFAVAAGPLDLMRPPLETPAATNRLIAAGDRTATWIEKNVKPTPVNAMMLNDAIRAMSLDDNHIDDRHAAGDRVDTFGSAAEPYLRDALRNAPGEFRSRVDNALTRIAVTPIGDENARRVAVATRVLEVIGTPKAMAVRAALVGMKPAEGVSR